eukprot:CAMPEP_0195259352 /NCGR_PEP_ID=MMETSP0706-20130129/7906_1 /TAXON_ID=33640 /ORGANISM="Asterionellopsis glacialis, Strain CCMP134" /LENGTH=150 /DNA_ID=CAMNT_0040312821 /DNA_START=29 /DNA_END=477 /DNA_ORIENTATION=+
MRITYVKTQIFLILFLALSLTSDARNQMKKSTIRGEKRRELDTIYPDKDPIFNYTALFGIDLPTYATEPPSNTPTIAPTNKPTFAPVASDTFGTVEIKDETLSPEQEQESGDIQPRDEAPIQREQTSGIARNMNFSGNHMIIGILASWFA